SVIFNINHPAPPPGSTIYWKILVTLPCIGSTVKAAIVANKYNRFAHPSYLTTSEFILTHFWKFRIEQIIISFKSQ
ncbi:hypothetical protein, partial [Bacillus cereus]|uniref:hypothetical protein n=1 Tax=Bacillus cereus TaxID=1396 RepID=UPI001C666EC6